MTVTAERKVKATILGCGSSTGVPRVGGDWGACNPLEPRNRRRRCSLAIEIEQPCGLRPYHLVIDTSPDFREQMLDIGWLWLDAVFYTHDHADQAHGIDDVRAFFMERGQPMAAYADEVTAHHLNHRFHYIFHGEHGYPPTLNLKTLDEQGAEAVGETGLIMRYFSVDHGPIKALGYRLGGLAYLPDVSRLPPQARSELLGLDLLILDCLRYHPHPTHTHLARSLAWIEELKPRHTVLTNMHTQLDYQTLKQSLPPTIEPAYDGLGFDFTLIPT